jgi:hypothetical protein
VEVKNRTRKITNLSSEAKRPFPKETGNLETSNNLKHTWG